MTDKRKEMENRKTFALYILMRALIYGVIGFAAGVPVHMFLRAVIFIPSNLTETCFLTAGYAVIFGGILAGFVHLLRRQESA